MSTTRQRRLGIRLGAVAALFLAPHTARAADPLRDDDALGDLGVDLPEPELPIVNGKEEGGFPQAVAIGAFGFAMCSGSVITPRVVLTAGHCSADLPIELVVSLGSIYFGESVTAPDHEIGIVDAMVHPGYVPLGTVGASQTLPEFDIAVIELEQDAPYEPIWFNTRPLGNKDLGETVTSVGYGITSAQTQSGSGVKRSAKLNVDEIDDFFVISLSSSNDGANICSGDSGGPQYHKDKKTGEWEQWAVHSWGDGGCVYNSGSTRTDVAAEFILDFVEGVHGTTDQCAILGRYSDGTCDAGCDEPDPDCVVASLLTTAVDPAGGCDHTPTGAPAGALALIGLLGLRRRR